jgi:hypothetical protein
MVIQFPDGSAMDSSVLAGMYVETGRPVIHVYAFRDNLGGLLMGGTRPTASHFMSIVMGTAEEAERELKKLVAQWLGKPMADMLHGAT